MDSIQYNLATLILALSLREGPQDHWYLDWRNFNDLGQIQYVDNKIHS